MDAVSHVAERAHGDADGLISVVEGGVLGDVVHGVLEGRWWAGEKGLGRILIDRLAAHHDLHGHPFT